KNDLLPPKSPGGVSAITFRCNAELFRPHFGLRHCGDVACDWTIGLANYLLDRRIIDPHTRPEKNYGHSSNQYECRTISTTQTVQNSQPRQIELNGLPHIDINGGSNGGSNMSRCTTELRKRSCHLLYKVQ